MKYLVIPYQKQFAPQIAGIYHQAVHGIDTSIYNHEERAAWSYKPRSAQYWHYRLSRSQAWLLLVEQTHPDDILLNKSQSSESISSKAFSPKPLQCCGFINVETQFYSRGYIDSLYILPQHQGQGGAFKLYCALEQWALSQNYNQLRVDASRVSKSFFSRQGFVLHHKSYQERRGQVLQSFAMSKML